MPCKSRHGFIHRLDVDVDRLECRRSAYQAGQGEILDWQNSLQFPLDSGLVVKTKKVKCEKRAGCKPKPNINLIGCLRENPNPARHSFLESDLGSRSSTFHCRGALPPGSEQQHPAAAWRQSTSSAWGTWENMSPTR